MTDREADKDTEKRKRECNIPDSHSEFLEELCLLPRPQVVVDDVNFLENFSIRALKLTLRDILLESSEKKEVFEEFPPVFSSDTVAITDPQTPNAKIHLNKNMLISKLKELQALKDLYDNEIEWLCCGSRLWFGQLTDENVSLFVDFSDAVCFSESHIQYLEALNLLFTEQIQQCKKANVNLYGTEVVNLDVSGINSEVLDSIQPQGNSNLLHCLQVAIKTLCNTDCCQTLFIIVSSKPDQDLEILYDYVLQLLSGQIKIKIHVTAVNVDEDVQIFLHKIADLVDGHYHQFSMQDPKRALEDSLINKIKHEKEGAEKCISDLECIIRGTITQPLIDHLRQLSLIVDWNESDDCHFCSLYSSPFSTEVWLRTYGLDYLGLNLYNVLEPDTFNQLSEYVPVINRTAFSTVYDVMPKFIWKDGSQKYLHVDVHKLENYVADLKIYYSLLQKRLVWLQSGSRIVFGNLAEDRVLVIVDSSLKASLHIIELKQHLKTLLQEQLSDRKSFNFISYSGNQISSWREHLCYPDKESVTDAWRWILDINPSGNSNLLSCLQYMITSCLSLETNSSTIGIYLILSSIPDQDVDCVAGYLEQALSASNIRFHVVLYQPIAVDPDIEAVLLKGIGRYAEETDLITYAKELSEIAAISTLHKFIHGEFKGSDDHSDLVREVSRTIEYMNLAEEILENYRIHCKRNVPTTEEQANQETKADLKFCWLTPITPRPTLASLVRMNCNAIKLKELNDIDDGFNNQKKTKNLILTYQTFYTGQGLRKGMYYDLVDLSDFVLRKSLVPPKEACVSSAEWLQKHSLESLGLYNKRMFTPSKTGFKHVTPNGKIVQLALTHQQLNKRLLQIKQVKQRYFSRLQWLLSNSRLIFGCLIEKKIVLLVDISASVGDHFSDLISHFFDLINEQFLNKRSSFNIVTYAQKTSVWKPQMAPCTKENRCEAQQWINSLSVGGSSNLLEGINTSLRFKPHAIYVITDGETDHSHRFMLSQVSQLKLLYPYDWKINTIAYHGKTSEKHQFLQQLAHNTGGRYHCYPTDKESDKTLLQHSHLGDDLRILVNEIQLADSTVSKLLYYTGRLET